MLGIESRWECPACGNVIKSNNPFWNKELRKKVIEPTKCGCGRKTGFKLIDFAPCQYEIIPNGYKITEENKEE